MPNEDISWDYPLANTVYGRILLRTVERVKALNLDCIEQSKVELRKLAWHTGDTDTLQPPYVIVSPRTETTDWRDGTNERDAIGYAAMITVCLANTRDVSIKGMGLQLHWRRRLRQSFHNKTSKDWPELSWTGLEGAVMNHSYMEAGDVFIDPAKRMQMDAQFWLVRFNCWEPRE